MDFRFSVRATKNISFDKTQQNHKRFSLANHIITADFVFDITLYNAIMTMLENSLRFSRETAAFVFVPCAGWRTHVPTADEQKTTLSDLPCNPSAGDELREREKE